MVSPAPRPPFPISTVTEWMPRGDLRVEGVMGVRALIRTPGAPPVAVWWRRVAVDPAHVDAYGGW